MDFNIICKLGDLGALHLRQASNDENDVSDDKTSFGTFCYNPPEYILKEGKKSIRDLCDVWGLAVTLLLVKTGRHLLQTKDLTSSYDILNEFNRGTFQIYL